MTKRNVSGRLRRLVKERAHFCCEYCLSQEAYSPDPFSIEHIIPLNAGGQSTEDNLALACQGCNNFKYNKTLGFDRTTLREIPLFHPRRDNWPEHFMWSLDMTKLIGLTPIGRATIEELRLNRENVVNLRRVLALAGKHPPAHHSSSA